MQTIAKIQLNELHSVERIGGGSRIPCISDLLQKCVQKELSRTLDANESIARGCTIMAAILSPRYQVQSFAVKDFLASPIVLEMQYEGETSSAKKVLFAQGSDMGRTLSITVKKKEIL